MILIKKKFAGNIKLYDVPYSEHSSYSELKDFVRAIKPSRVIPTVPFSSHYSLQKDIFDQWLSNTPLQQ